MKKKSLTKANVIYHLNREVYLDDKKHTLVGMSSYDAATGKYDAKTLIVTLMDEHGAFAAHDISKTKLESWKAAKSFDFKAKKSEPAE